MSGFITREVLIPQSPPPDTTSFAAAQHRGGSLSGSTNRAASPSQAELPVLPDSLLDALNREPPSSSTPDWAQLATSASGQPQPRPSFSNQREIKTAPSISGLQTATDGPVASGSGSPSLPSLAPSSPLNLPFTSKSPAASPQTQPSPGKSSKRSKGVEMSAEESFAYAMGDRLPPRKAKADDSPSKPRSMWKAVAFGRNKSSDGSDTSLQQLGQAAASSSKPPLAFTTTSASPVSSRLAPSPVISPTSSSSKLNLAPTTAPGIVGRRPSAVQLGLKQSGGREQGSKWLYEAQEANAQVTRSISRKSSIAHLDGSAANAEAPQADAADDAEAEDDISAAEAAAHRRSMRRRSRRAGQSLGAENDGENGRRGSWRIDRPQEQYTHDLGPAALGVAYLSEDESGGSSQEATDTEELTTPELDQVEDDGPDADETQNAYEMIGKLNLARVTAEDDANTIGMPSPSLITPRQSTSGQGAASQSLGARRRSSAATVTDNSGVYPTIERLRQMGPIEEPPSPTQPSPGHLPAPPPTAVSHAGPQHSNADFVVAIVGPRNVGKSTVIKRGLKRASGKSAIVSEDERGNRVTTSTNQFSIAGQTRSIEVLEIDMALLKYNAEGVIWPEGIPPCEGAMLCYDSTDPHALDSLSILLKAFWTRGQDVPLIVLACKANPDLSLNATDTNKAAGICNVFGAGIVSLDGGVEDKGRKMKESFNWMVRTIMDNRGEPRRPSSAMSALQSTTDSSRRSSVQHEPPSQSLGGTGGRASPVKPASATRVSFENPFGENAPASGGPSNGALRSNSRTGSLGLGLSIVEEAPLAQTLAQRKMSVAVAQAEQQLSRPTTPASAAAPSQVEQPPPPLAAAEKRASTAVNKTSQLDLHFSREDMIDKFLFAAVTGNDEQYVTLFLIVFRRFARPYDVLKSLIERFDFVAGRLKTDPLLSRFAQIKLCGVLSTWFQTYPGDFTAPSTFGLLQPFLNNLLPRGANWVAHYAIELIPLLADLGSMRDPEASWALPDKPLELDTPNLSLEPAPVGANPFRRPSVAPSLDSLSSRAPSHKATDLTTNFVSVPDSTAPSTAPSSTDYPLDGGAGGVHRRTGSDTKSIDTFDSSETGRIGSANSSNRPSKGGSMAGLLEISNALLEIGEDVIAQQITRIAWQSFAEMTPRDLMRHVLAPRDPKNPRSVLRNVNSNVMRSINFVNYLADWVATMVLVQAKLKWRARVLEKLITVAYALRGQENFDSLMGILAGLNSQPIFRLTETMELINHKLEGDKAKLPKRLRSLNKLMASTKSFAAYRLALATSGVEMIPYLGVHLQDITVVNEVKKDMRDGKVNWSKFSQMGRSAAIVLDCARQAPAIPINHPVEKLILNVPVLDKDRQYTLSYQYQPRASDRAGTSTRDKLRSLVDKSFSQA